MQRESKHILRSITCFFKKNHPVYEIVLKNFVDSERPQVTIWLKRNARWINKATETQLEYVIGPIH